MTGPVPIERFLADLFHQGIRLWMDGGSLRCTGPDMALTPEVTAGIRDRKTDILAFFNDNEKPEASPLSIIVSQGSSHPPLSFAQQRLWFVEQMLPGTAQHQMPFAIEATGDLDEAALEQALLDVTARHGVLRARISSQAGEARQTILPQAEIPVTRSDRRSNPPSNPELQSLILAEARRPFDLSREPPLRLAIVRLANDRTLLLFTLHHIAADGPSIEILTNDLAIFYRNALSGSGAALAPLPIQYGDFALWQRDQLNGRLRESQMKFWRERLAQPLPVTRLPADFARPPVQSHSGALVDFHIPADTTAAIRRLAAGQGATLFAALFTAFDILLYRYTGQVDLIVGTPVANRRQSETEKLIGLFVNPLAIRARIEPSRSFIENLARLKGDLLASFEHQDVPFEQLVEELQPERDASASPLFQIKFQLDPQVREHIDLPGVQLRRLPRNDGVAKLDLSMDLREMPNGIAGSLEYDTALFRPETVELLAECFTRLLGAIVQDPHRPVADLEMLGEERRHRQIVEWNDTLSALDEALCFPQLFEKQTVLTPDAIALTYVADGSAMSLTYDALNRRANRLAHHLRQLGAGPEVVVAIALDRGPELVAAWLAVLKSGAAYLPLDPAYPADRIAYMLADSGADLILTTSGMKITDAGRRIDLDTGWPEGTDADLPPLAGPDNLAYVIYTSGSTGRAKGVLVPHAGLVNLTQDKIRTCDIRPGDCVLQFFSFSFDASIPEFVMSLGAGARLLLAPAGDVLPGPSLTGLLQAERVTHVTMTPSALLSLPSADYPDLRMVLVGGEAPSEDLIARWSKDRVFINAYGPTETTVNASMVACGNGAPTDATVRPAANKQLYVLDEHLQPLPPGVPGELYIGGVGLARGYHRRPDITAAHFLPDPFAPEGRSAVLYRSGDRACQLPDGRIRVLGRVDQQVKIRGYRIEPGEVEAAVLDLKDVASAVVIVREDTAGEKRLAAYAVAADAGHPSASEMRAKLAARLPRYMVPDAFVWLDALPLTVNGKADVTKLPKPEIDSQGREPEGETETILAGLFEDLLGVSGIRATDDFFELGGHSLLATRLVAAALDRFGIELSVLDLFNGPTIEALADRIEARRAGADTRSLSPGGLLSEQDSWQRDLVLDDDIRPRASVAKSHTPGTRVLLTGATGFVGAFLLRELLRQENCEVVCLVRGETGAARLEQALRDYGLWHPDLAGRFSSVAGDLTQPNLGLDPERYVELAQRIDTIFHNAAEVHHVMPYERLRLANVEGTRGVLRFACAAGGRPLHYVSSLSVLPAAPMPDRPRFYETDALSDYPPPIGGYNRSKWVAEQLVSEAGRRGLPVAIYRPGPVSGDSRNGTFNEADFLCRVLQGYLHSGTAPEGDLSLDFLPVDYLARALVYLSQQPESTGRTYNLIHSRPVSSDILFEACKAEGMPIRRVSYQAWHKALMEIAHGDTQHPLYPLVALFAARSEDEATEAHVLPFDCGNSRAALADAPFDEPPLDLDLFRTYLRAFVRSGAASPPQSGDRLP